MCSSNHRRLLIVDDVPDNRATLVRRLVRRGFEVVEAECGVDALDLIDNRNFDLILLDIGMPGMDGIAVLKTIRESYSASALPVIMVTAYDEASVVVSALELGANDYVTKPVDFPVVLARIEAQMARKKAEEDLLEANKELERQVLQRTAELCDANVRLTENSEKLRTALDRAEIADRTRSEFLKSISHELRTPLHAVIGFAELIHNMTASRDADTADYAEEVLRSSRHLLTLINDIIELSKLDTGRIDLRVEPVELGSVVRRCTAMLAENSASAGVKIVVETADDFPLILGDPLRLKQIFLNLLSNAIKFTPARGQITVARHEDIAGRVVIAVTDTGVGMNAEQVRTARAIFQQVDGSLSRSREGTGLGLPLVERLVRLHGGEIAIESEVGVGTTVKIMLPAMVAGWSSPAPVGLSA